MRTLRAWLLRVRGLLFPASVERELAAELESHLQHHIDDNIRAGMPRAEARRTALLRYGPVESVKDAYRDRSTLPSVEGLLRDVRFGCRTLLRRPGFALAAMTTLALGIGANTAVFSVVDAVLLRPLPYPAPERVVQITGPGGQAFIQFGPVLNVAPRELRDNSSFAAIGLYVAGAANLGGDPAIRIPGAAVSPSFFRALGVTPLMGHTFTDADIVTSDRLVVISHRIWRDRLSSDPQAVGRTLTIDGSPFTVTGVMPAEVSFPAASQLWISTNAPTELMGTIPAPRLIARLADGVTHEHARAEIVRVSGYKEPRASRIRVVPLRESLIGAVRPVAVVIWIASALVLLIACINAANLLLARVSSREREFAVRRALGASRAQLVRQVLIESLVLSTAAAVVAVPAAIWTVEAARVLLPAQLHGVPEIAINGRALALTGGAAVLTALLFGIGPCLSIQASRGEVLRAQAAGSVAPFWRRFRSVLLVAEVAITMLLLAGATTLVANVRSIMRVDTGARGDRALAIELTLAGDRYSTPALRASFFARLRESVGSLPGVEAAGVSNMLPGRAPQMLLGRPMVLDGQTPLPKDAEMAARLVASPGYFEAAGVDLLAGRHFSEHDRPGSPPVVIVSEGYARAVGVAPGTLIGMRAGGAGTTRDNKPLPPEEIVGVVRDVRLRGPEDSFDEVVYSPLAVAPGNSGSAYLVVKAAGDPRELTPAIREIVRGIDPDLPLFNIHTFEQLREALLGERRFAMMTMVAFAGLAFLLSAIGLYGVINYLVQLRTREIGIRLAIGATRSRICREVLMNGALHGVTGVAAGLAVTAGVSSLVASKVRGMERMDPALLAGLAVLVIAVSAAATWIPAWRATRIDPAVTLRAE